MKIIELQFLEDKGDNIIAIWLLGKKVMNVLVKESYFKEKKVIAVEQDIDMGQIMSQMAGGKLNSIFGGKKK
jgi:predicted ester cyclase